MNPHQALHESEGLVAFGGSGAVEVHAYEHGSRSASDTTTMLIEPRRPGTELRCRPEAEQHVVITDLLRQLQQIRLDEGHRFRTPTSMCDEWADQTIARSTEAPKVLDTGLIRDGLVLFRALPRTADRETLLCTDPELR